MKNRKNSILLIIISVVLIMSLLFGGSLFLLSSMGYVEFKGNSSDDKVDEEVNGDVELKIDDNIESILDDKLEFVYTLFRSSPAMWCDSNVEESFTENIDDLYLNYSLSSKFSTKEELYDYLEEYISSDLLDKLESKDYYNFDLYKEKDGKLYCYNSGKATCNNFISGQNVYDVDFTSDNSISVSGKIAYSDCGVEGVVGYMDFNARLNKINDNWIVFSYEEQW